jgi:hypothetical protein
LENSKGRVFSDQFKKRLTAGEAFLFVGGVVGGAHHVD